MKTQREIETAVCNDLVGFAREYLGRRPRIIRAHLLDGLLVVRLEGVLNAAEEQLLRVSEKNKGRDLLKEMRTQLIETARPILTTLIEEITGLFVLSLHHDISTVTGEEVIMFTLVEAPPQHPSRK